MPRLRSEHADQKTDIFALGSAIYYIMEGHEPFPDLDPDDDEAQIMERFKLGWLPDIGHSLMNAVMQKCWLGTYISISAVLQDLQFAKAK